MPAINPSHTSPAATLESLAIQLSTVKTSLVLLEQTFQTLVLQLQAQDSPERPRGAVDAPDAAQDMPDQELSAVSVVTDSNSSASPAQSSKAGKRAGAGPSQAQRKAFDALKARWNEVSRASPDNAPALVSILASHGAVSLLELEPGLYRSVKAQLDALG